MQANPRAAATLMLSTSSAPTSAPASMASTEARRRHGRLGLAAPMRLSAARPDSVKVSTVVVRSGTAKARAVAFCNPRRPPVWR